MTKLCTTMNMHRCRLLWDEAMGNGASSWLASHPGGFMVSLLGNDHVKFGCGAAARCAHTRPTLASPEHEHQALTRTPTLTLTLTLTRCARTLGGVEQVRTVLINPRSGDTTRSTDLRRPALPLTALQLPFAASGEVAGSAAWLKRPSLAGSRQPMRSPTT